MICFIKSIYSSFSLFFYVCCSSMCFLLQVIACFYYGLRLSAEIRDQSACSIHKIFGILFCLGWWLVKSFRLLWLFHVVKVVIGSSATESSYSESYKSCSQCGIACRWHFRNLNWRLSGGFSWFHIVFKVFACFVALVFRSLRAHNIYRLYLMISRQDELRIYKRFALYSI